MKKKILALVLAVVMCVTTLSVAVFAADIKKVPSTIPNTDIAYNRVENVTVKIPGTDFIFELKGVSDMVGLIYEEDGTPVYRFAFYEGGTMITNTDLPAFYGFGGYWIYEDDETSEYRWVNDDDGGYSTDGFGYDFSGEFETVNAPEPSITKIFVLISNKDSVGDTIAKVEFLGGHGGSYKDLWSPYDLMSYEEIVDNGTNLVPAEIEKIDISKLAVTDENTSTEPKYSVTKGANSVWDSSSNEGLTITADGDFSKFTGIKIDNELLDPANYEAKSGSTVVTLKESYLKTLSSGKHTVTFVYTDGEVGTQIEIKGAKAPSISQNVEIPNTDSEFSNIAAVYAFIAIMSVFGVAVIRRKKYLVK